MNIQEIDKWLDNEYGCSYTRLEELHDFVVEQDLKHREEKDKEIEKLNNIIKEIEDYINFLVIYNQTISGKFSETQWGQDILGLIGSDEISK